MDSALRSGEYDTTTTTTATTTTTTTTTISNNDNANQHNTNSNSNNIDNIRNHRCHLDRAKREHETRSGFYTWSQSFLVSANQVHRTVL